MHEHQLIGLERGNAGQPIDGRREQQAKDEGFRKPAEQAVQIMQPLRQGEIAAPQRPGAQKSNLDGAETPARALRDILRQAFCR